MTPIEYAVISKSSTEYKEAIQLLTDSVQGAVAKGYRPQGGLVAFVVPGIGFVVSQALVRSKPLNG